MPSTLRQTFAFGASVARYWTTVAPVVDRELARWNDHADRIPDPALRDAAQTKLADAGAHAQVAALIATIAPRPWRRTVVTAQVALEVMFDYLDTLSEQPHPDPHANGALLYTAFAAALGGAGGDYYRLHPQRHDGGYLEELIAVARLAFLALPASDHVAEEARRVARLCGEAQTRTHATAVFGTDRLAEWAAGHSFAITMTWWEIAAGWCAAILAVHALVATAANPSATTDDAALVTAAYLPISALSTLLDSLTDRNDDARTGSHTFVGYYPDPLAAARAITRVAREAQTAGARTPNGPHDAMTVAGTAAFYLTGRIGPYAQPTAAALVAELSPVIYPILAMFWLWRTSSRLRH